MQYIETKKRNVTWDVKLNGTYEGLNACRANGIVGIEHEVICVKYMSWEC